MYKAGGLLRIWHEFYENFFFDILNSTNTHERLSVKEYKKNIHDIESAYDYVPSYASSISKSIHKIIMIDKDVLKDQFIDIGSGKGKALIIASQLGFKNGTGYEINLDLCNIGNKNLKKKKIYDRFKVINSSAMSQNNIPKFSICYMYNPFNENMSKVFFDMIYEKKLSKKRYLIYVNPIYSKHLNKKFKLVTKFNVGTQGIGIWSF
tara:strand:- start:11351 stop:11971 length:621 start_codon:yes stop_codon:yes gene_type:complete